MVCVHGYCEGGREPGGWSILHGERAIIWDDRWVVQHISWLFMFVVADLWPPMSYGMEQSYCKSILFENRQLDCWIYPSSDLRSFHCSLSLVSTI